MTKEQLEKLGITEEGKTDDEIIDLILASRKGDQDKIERLSAENEKGKNLISKRNSEIAELKEKVNGSKTEEEKHKEYVANLEKEKKDLENKLKGNEVKTKYLSMGYDEDEAKKVAEATLDGNYDLVAKYTKAHQDKVVEATKAELLKKTPAPNPNEKGGEGDKYFTKENFKAGKIKWDDLLKLQKENRELYDKITL